LAAWEEEQMRLEDEAQMEHGPMLEGDVPTASAAFAPQLRFDASGRIIVDQETLQVTANRAARAVVAGQVEEESGLGVTSSAYMHRAPSTAWALADTYSFFEALRLHGTDFTLIAAKFPDRNRRQIKNKFKREEKERPQVIELLLTMPTSLTAESLQEMIRPKHLAVLPDPATRAPALAGTGTAAAPSAAAGAAPAIRAPGAVASRPRTVAGAAPAAVPAAAHVAPYPAAATVQPRLPSAPRPVAPPRARPQSNPTRARPQLPAPAVALAAPPAAQSAPPKPTLLSAMLMRRERWEEEEEEEVPPPPLALAPEPDEWEEHGYHDEGY